SHISPIDRVIQFAENFPDQILDKSQLQRFLSNPPPWSSVHTEIVKQIKVHVKTLPCLGIPSVDSFKIVETDASKIGYRVAQPPKTKPTSPCGSSSFLSTEGKSKSELQEISRQLIIQASQMDDDDDDDATPKSESSLSQPQGMFTYQ
ncbi:unnamed protein product, partial [Prunus brigantina]